MGQKFKKKNQFKRFSKVESFPSAALGLLKIRPFDNMTLLKEASLDPHNS